ncbi:DegT/DnrJ/EryC1/StrS aminotransferase family protein [Oceanicoccus sp. KOV_DT_Chl]|uniref:DegT/DnrJ/EryC1/StrS family aminotransferase n=1 Tax=Oceanicoccus sp. KOV_DT_Chl TaxID=1904639 RepID=UPI000C7CA324|nr:DegT/DnrJ/EryC1/StrS family aminotransferase [Oceanicoccus sp. KOV_DT_Chl]
MNHQVPFFSAEAVNSEYDLLSPIDRVIKSNWYVLGKEVSSFEAEFAKYCGVEFCTGVANGTDALEIGLRSLGVGPNDTVVLSANSGFYGSTAVLRCGATPRYVDVDPVTLTISPASLGDVLIDSPKAIIVTHLYGQMAQVEAIVRLADRYNIPVIEDCAQAHGAEISSNKAGSFGAIGCFSFYPTKNLGALGDGGAIVCKDKNLFDSIMQLRQYGWSKKYTVAIEGGGNSRLDEIQASVLRCKLRYLDDSNLIRRDIAKRYSAAFSSIPVTCPAVLDSSYVAHLYVLQTEQRDELREFLLSKGIGVDIHYPIPDHQQPIFDGRYSGCNLPITEMLSRCILSLPCFPGLSLQDVDYVVDNVINFFERGNK